MKSQEEKIIKLGDVKKLFHKTLKEAAKILDVTEDELKCFMKDNHFRVWPQKRLLELNEKLAKINKRERKNKKNIVLPSFAEGFQQYINE